MNWIELLGPAGAGKTHLLNNLNSIRKKGDWYFLQEAFLLIAKNLDNKFTSDLSDRIIKIYLNQNLTSVLKSKLAFDLINENRYILPEIEKYFSLLESHLSAVTDAKHIGVFKKVNSVQNYLTIIRKMSILDFFNFQDVVLLDEGPIRHHADLNEIEFTSHTLPSGIIYCTLDHEENYQRIIKRKEAGKSVPAHIGKSEMELIQHIEISSFNLKRKVERMKLYDVPVYEIDLLIAPTKLQINEMTEFIKDNSTSKLQKMVS